MVHTNTLAVILNWNSAADTLECSESLLMQTLHCDVLIIDNNSSDDSVKVIAEYARTRSGVSLLKNDRNLGFAGGINTGLKYARRHDYKYAALLNPDATAENEWISSLVYELETHNDASIAGGLMLHKNGKTIDGAGDEYTTWGLPGPRCRNEPKENAPSETEYIFGATGGGMLIRLSLFDTINYFDEKFFMYYEDVDLCFRAQLAGRKVRYTPKAIAYHAQGSSTKKVPGLAVYNTFKNIPMLLIKDVPIRLFPRILPRFLLTYVLIFGNAVFNGNGLPAVKGLISFIRLIPHSLVERRRIQSKRIASVKYIDSIILHDIPKEQTGLRKFRSFFTVN